MMMTHFQNCLSVGLTAATLWAGSVSAQTIGGVPTTAGVHNLQFTDTANPVVGVRDYTLKLPVGYVHGSGTDHRFVLLLHGAGQTLPSFLSSELG